MKLYSFPFSPNCQKVVAIAHEVGVPLEVVDVALFKGESHTPAILAKNPNGKVPILEDGDFVLWESAAMLAYIAAKAGRADLAPTTLRERAEVDRWTAWEGAHFSPAIRKVAFERIVKKLAGLGAPDEAAIRSGSEEFATRAAVLEQSLGSKEYVCGRLTIADFALAPYAALTASIGLDFEPYPKAKAWLERMAARDSMKKTFAYARGAA
ncbi:MAG: putative glutathione S-transferase-like protein [Labilithrix sp.]|nr:putative glutathione S-transferase-like protein [Labilithrix sp.]